MICSEVRKHREENEGYINLEWLKEHVKTCDECKATMDVVTTMIEDTLTED